MYFLRANNRMHPNSLRQNSTLVQKIKWKYYITFIIFPQAKIHINP